MNESRISIIVPCYNVEEYIHDTIASVLKQNYNNYELILINDGSIDKTGEICEEYMKKYNNINVIHQKNSGPSIARNIGIKHATGDYIVFLDSDDILINEALIKINNKINKENVDVLLGQMHEIVFPRGTIEKRINLIDIEFNKYDVLKNIIQYSPLSITYIWRNVYRREYIIKNEIFFQEKVLCAEDMDWNTRIFFNNPSVAKIDFYTHRYRGNRIGSIVTENSYNKVYDLLKIANKWLKYADEVKDDELKMCIKIFYSKAVFSNLKFIFCYNKNEIEKLLIIIKKSLFWEYPSTKETKNIVKLKKIIGINNTLKILNINYKIFIFLKNFLIKLKILDK